MSNYYYLKPVSDEEHRALTRKNSEGKQPVRLSDYCATTGSQIAEWNQRKSELKLREANDGFWVTQHNSDCKAGRPLRPLNYEKAFGFASWKLAKEGSADCLRDSDGKPMSPMNGLTIRAKRRAYHGTV